jgi:hypothetical protein
LTTRTTAAEYEYRCYALFTAIFRVLKATFEALPDQADGKALVAAWNKKMCNLKSTYREEWFKKLAQAYQTVGNLLLYIASD